MSNEATPTVFVVQHCQSEHHVGVLTGGWTDSPLTELGRRQAERVGHAVRGRLAAPLDRCYSSDLLRASQTAETVAGIVECPVVLEPDIRERNNGAATGKTKGWAAANAAPRPIAGRGLDRRPFEGAETPREFFVRVIGCVDRLVSSAHDELLIVTHGGTVGVIVAWWLGMSVEQYDVASFATAAGSITTLGTDDWGRRALLRLADDRHLADLPA